MIPQRLILQQPASCLGVQTRRNLDRIGIVHRGTSCVELYTPAFSRRVQAVIMGLMELRWSIPNRFEKPRRPFGVTETARPSLARMIQPNSSVRARSADPSAPAR